MVNGLKWAFSARSSPNAFHIWGSALCVRALQLNQRPSDRQVTHSTPPRPSCSQEEREETDTLDSQNRFWSLGMERISGLFPWLILAGYPRLSVLVCMSSVCSSVSIHGGGLADQAVSRTEKTPHEYETRQEKDILARAFLF